MTQSPTLSPLCPNGVNTPILYIDTHAPLDELQAFAEQRVRSVAHMLDSLALIGGHALEGRDLARVAQLSAWVLEEGCEVMALIQHRLAQQTR